jgi:tripartite-type tricarboxylate transporter receptor subunit TctC
LRKDLPYDSLKDFEPITQIISGRRCSWCAAGLAIHSVKELIAYAKANPGQAQLRLGRHR